MVEDKIKEYISKDEDINKDNINVKNKGLYYEGYYKDDEKPKLFIVAKYLKENYSRSDKKMYYTVHYECPFCWSKYKKNGEPYKTAKRVIHHHGTDKKENHFIGHRHFHCHDKTYYAFNQIDKEKLKEFEFKKYNGVNVIIDDSTLKPLKIKSYYKLECQIRLKRN